MRSERRGEARRAHVATAARALFLEQGFGATSMNAIARAAGVSKETLYAHFHSKEEVLVAALAGLVELDTGAPRALAAAPPRTGSALELEVLAWARRLLRQLTRPEHVALLRVVVGEGGRLPELGEAYRRGVADRALDGARALLARAADGGLV